VTQYNYVFFWKISFGPYSNHQEKKWQPFDEANQKHLNLLYQNFCKNTNNYIFNLLSPANDCALNFKKQILFDFDTKMLYAIKLEEQTNKQIQISTQIEINLDDHENCAQTINKIEIKNNEENNKSQINLEIQNQPSINHKEKKIIPLQNDEELLFFCRSNKDPWDSDQKATWTPYDLEDELKLKLGYQQYLIENKKNFIDLKYPQDHFIDFSKMLQINKHNPNLKRPVKRSHSKLVTNVFRISRFDYQEVYPNIHFDLIPQQYLNDNDFKSFLKNTNSLKSKKINKIIFNVFPECSYELEIEERLCFFDDQSIIDISLQKIKSILIDEMGNLGKELGYLTIENSQIEYKSHIDKIEDCKTFYQKIIYMYIMEGYLYKTMNKFLRNYEKLGLEKIKYFYICLLASFQYFSQNTKIPQNEDLIIYRASLCSEDEFKKCENLNLSNFICIFKEFLSTSINPEIANSFFDKDEDYNIQNTKKLLWEIRIPKELIINEPSNFADISKFSQFSWEKEILIRSGAIIQIDQIHPYTQQIEAKTIEYSNKYKKICTLKSFSQTSFIPISLDPSIKTLDLSNNNLGVNEINIIYLREALVNNNSIQYLDLSLNKLGANEKNMLNLKEALEKNNSIKKLTLTRNQLGGNDKNMLYLKEALEINNSIQTLNLENYVLGANENNMLYLKEALEKNNSIQILYLGYNYLGANENNMLYLKEALEKNNSIKELYISANELGLNENNILYVKEFLEKNISIQKLSLKYNNLGGNENNILYLKEALEKNNSIKELNIEGNNLLENEKNILKIFKNIFY